MKHLFVILAIVIADVFLYAQNITFIYELKYKPNSSLDTFKKENYYLDVLGKQSVFRSENDRKSDSIKEKNGFGLAQKVDFEQLYVFKNLINQKIICISV